MNNTNQVVITLVRDGKERSVHINLEHFDRYYGNLEFGLFAQVVLAPAISQLCATDAE